MRYDTFERAKSLPWTAQLKTRCEKRLNEHKHEINLGFDNVKRLRRLKVV